MKIYLSPENRPDYGLTEGPCREETTQQMRTGRLPAFKNRSDSCLPAPCISIQKTLLPERFNALRDRRPAAFSIRIVTFSRHGRA